MLYDRRKEESGDHDTRCSEEKPPAGAVMRYIRLGGKYLTQKTPPPPNFQFSVRELTAISPQRQTASDVSRIQSMISHSNSRNTARLLGSRVTTIALSYILSSSGHSLEAEPWRGHGANERHLPTGRTPPYQQPKLTKSRSCTHKEGFSIKIILHSYAMFPPATAHRHCVSPSCT